MSTAETDKLIADVFAKHSQSVPAAEAFDDLNHRLLLAREQGEEVPCLGPGAEAWTSDDVTDQELAADRCLDCPAMLLCKQYADLAGIEAGTWGGVTREPPARERRRRRMSGGSHSSARRPVDSGLACTCGCGGVTKGGWYLSGHDSQHLAALRSAVRAGDLSLNAALAEVAHSPALRAKLTARVGG